MATASKVHLSLHYGGLCHVPNLTQDSADAASKVLQENHEIYHIFFNHSAFHNHIAHHIPTLFALGASPDAIQKHYANNTSYQRPLQPVDRDLIQSFHENATFLKYLGQERYYHDYLIFFEYEIGQKGHEEVLNEYMLKGNERADEILVRMFTGFLHPIIHLGFGIEFNQPAIIAEALAQAAVHVDWIGPYLSGVEKAAAGTVSSKPLVDILDQIRADSKLRNAAHWDEHDANKLFDGILGRAPQEMTKYAAQWRVDGDELESKTAEMTNAAVYFTGSAQHPPKQIKFDFYYMHCVNSSIFFSSFVKQSWISTKNKIRLLQFKGWLDLAMYTSRRAPELLLDEVVNYHPKQPDGSWEDIFQRVIEHEDDGHVSKMVRALRHGEHICAGYDDDSRFRVKGDMWLKLGHMGEYVPLTRQGWHPIPPGSPKRDVPASASRLTSSLVAIDSVEDSGEPWVRNAGFDEAWEKYEDRPRAQL
ncbi:MAG: hypothetical protein Q9182_002732 [Xanthomendoza sp. 2 TL-2023]